MRVHTLELNLLLGQAANGKPCILSCDIDIGAMPSDENRTLPCTQDRGNTAEQLASLALAGPASLAQARTLAANTVAPQLLLASRLGDLRALLARLRAGKAHTAGPLAPYAAYLHLLVPFLTPCTSRCH